MPNQPQPRERPIVFMPEMVRQIFDGRKTATRRIAKKPTAVSDGEWDSAMLYASERGLCGVSKTGPRDGIVWTYRCPYGRPGDQLWVKERWSVRQRSGGCPSGDDYFIEVEYSDGVRRQFDCEDVPEAWTIPKRNAPANPRFMPRWASRLTLEVTNVRAERLQDITEEEAGAEGVLEAFDGYFGADEQIAMAVAMKEPVDSLRPLFALAWNEINGKRAPWSSNSWVWAVAFRRIN